VIRKTLGGILLAFSLLSAQEVVEKVLVKGNKYLSEEVIKGLIKTKEGEPFSLERVREDLRTLFRTGLFKRVEVYKEDEDGDGMPEVVFVVEDLPVIYKIEFEGNEKISDEELKERLGIETELGEVEVEETVQTLTASPAIEERLALLRRLKLGRVLTFEEIERLRKRIEEIYKKEGYEGTEVTYRIVPKKGASKLVFVIREGEKKFVGDIKVKGAKTLGEKKVKSAMELKPKSLLLFRWKPPYSSELLEEDVERIRELYRGEGFLEAQVSAKVKREGAKHDIEIEVKEGPRYKLKELKIEGNTLYAYSELVGDILKKNLKKGGYYRREVVEAIKRRIREKYANIGYLSVKVEEREEVDRERLR